MVKILVVALGVITLLPSVRAQGQEKFRLTGQARRSALAEVVTIPDVALPMIRNAAIVVAAGPNNTSSRQVTFAVKSPTGQYVARGFNSGEDAPIILGAWDFGLGGGPSTYMTIIDGNPNQVLPGIGQFWKVEVIHINGGSVEKLSAVTQPYVDTLSSLQFGVGADTLANGTYSLSIGGKFSTNASVAIGGFAVVDLSFSPFGGVVGSVPVAFIGSLSGMVTVTVCTSNSPDGSNGWCGTDSYRPKVTNPDGGKG